MIGVCDTCVDVYDARCRPTSEIELCPYWELHPDYIKENKERTLKGFLDVPDGEWYE